MPPPPSGPVCAPSLAPAPHPSLPAGRPRCPQHQISNVVFENADLAIAMDGCSFNTVQNVTFTSTRPKAATHPYFGGKGIWLKASTRRHAGTRGARC